MEIDNTEDWSLAVFGAKEGLQLTQEIGEAASSDVSASMLDISPDGRLFAAADGAGVVVGEMADLRAAMRGKQTRLAKKRRRDVAGVTQVAFLANSEQLVVAAGDQITVLDASHSALKTDAEAALGSEIETLRPLRTHVGFVCQLSNRKLLRGDASGVITEESSSNDITAFCVGNDDRVVLSSKFSKKNTVVRFVAPVPESSTFYVVYSPSDNLEDYYSKIVTLETDSRTSVDVEDACMPYGDTAQPFAWFQCAYTSKSDPKTKYTALAACSQATDLLLFTDTAKLVPIDDSTTLPFTSEDEDVIARGAALDVWDGGETVSPIKGIDTASGLPVFYLLTQEGRVLAWCVASRVAINAGARPDTPRGGVAGRLTKLEVVVAPENNNVSVKHEEAEQVQSKRETEEPEETKKASQDELKESSTLKEELKESTETTESPESKKSTESKESKEPKEPKRSKEELKEPTESKEPKEPKEPKEELKEPTEPTEPKEPKEPKEELKEPTEPTDPKEPKEELNMSEDTNDGPNEPNESLEGGLKDHQKTTSSIDEGAKEASEKAGSASTDNPSKHSSTSQKPGLASSKWTIEKESPANVAPSTAFGSFTGSNTSPFGNASSLPAGNKMFDSAGKADTKSVFGTSNGSLFGKTDNTKSAFGTNTKSAFGTSNGSLFGKSNNKSVFGTDTKSAIANGSSFGNTSTESPFGGVKGNIFAQKDPNTEKADKPSAFAGSSTTTHASSLFGNSADNKNSIFGNTSTKSPFGGVKGNIFAQKDPNTEKADKPSAFAGSSTTTQASSLFGNSTDNKNSIFGNTSTKSPFGGVKGNIFAQKDPNTKKEDKSLAFAGSSTTTAKTSSLFGNSADNKKSAFDNNTSTTTSPFGSIKGNVFAQPEAGADPKAETSPSASPSAAVAATTAASIAVAAAFANPAGNSLVGNTNKTTSLSVVSNSDTKSPLAALTQSDIEVPPSDASEKPLSFDKLSLADNSSPPKEVDDQSEIEVPADSDRSLFGTESDADVSDTDVRESDASESDADDDDTASVIEEVSSDEGTDSERTDSEVTREPVTAEAEEPKSPEADDASRILEKSLELLKLVARGDADTDHTEHAELQKQIDALVNERVESELQRAAAAKAAAESEAAAVELHEEMVSTCWPVNAAPRSSLREYADFVTARELPTNPFDELYVVTNRCLAAVDGALHSSDAHSSDAHSSDADADDAELSAILEHARQLQQSTASDLGRVANVATQASIDEQGANMLREALSKIERGLSREAYELRPVPVESLLLKEELDVQYRRVRDGVRRAENELVQKQIAGSKSSGISFWNLRVAVQNVSRRLADQRLLLDRIAEMESALREYAFPPVPPAQFSLDDRVESQADATAELLESLANRDVSECTCVL